MSISNNNLKKNLYKTTTRKKRPINNQLGGVFDKYAKTYENTPYIPKSTFISNMILEFPIFFKKQQEKEEFIIFTEIFIIDFKPNNIDKFSINQRLKTHPDYTLQKILETCIFLTSKSFFINNDTFYPSNHIIKALKIQMGKDILRTNIIINGTIFNASAGEDLDNFPKITDSFYETLITYFKTNGLPVNFNQINQLCLLCCQNMSNLMSDLVIIYLNGILTPEICAVYQANRKIKIEITKTSIILSLTLQSRLIISDDQMLDPERSCGNLLFKIKCDILNNAFEMSKFIVNINRVTCKVGDIKDSEPSFKLNIPLDSSLIPTAVSTVGIVSAPFILGAI